MKLAIDMKSVPWMSQEEQWEHVENKIQEVLKNKTFSAPNQVWSHSGGNWIDVHESEDGRTTQKYGLTLAKTVFSSKYYDLSPID